MNTLRDFVHATRAGATAITAAVVTLMTVAGSAFVIDHNWLVDQRDTLKNGSDAGSVAATKHMSRLLTDRPQIGDAELKAALDEVVRRYVVLNLQHLSEERRDLAMATLVVDVTPDRSTRTVDTFVQADLGGTLLATHLPMLSGSETANVVTVVRALVEQTRISAEVVLAIDMSSSMSLGVDGSRSVPESSSRMGVVKRAARELVDVLDPSPSHRIAVGLAPWSYSVRLDADMQTRWASNGWVRYPTSRHYPVPYGVSYGMSSPAGITQTLASTPPGTWRGCLDEHRVVRDSHAEWPPTSRLLDSPETLAFAQLFFPAFRNYVHDCHSLPLPDGFSSQFCYTEARAAGQTVRPEQFSCRWQGTPLLALTSDKTALDRAIDSLRPDGRGTYSTLGILWAQRMLSRDWRHVWGDSVHPLDPGDPDNEGLRKVIVLLTDGEDIYCGSDPGSCLTSDMGIDRTEACTLAKAQGTEIFVIAAMPPDQISSGMAEALRSCSSEGEGGDGTYVYINNSNATSLRDAFVSIAHQLREARRVY